MLNNSLNYIPIRKSEYSPWENWFKRWFEQVDLSNQVPHTCTLCICSKIMLGANPLYQLSHAWQATIIISSPCSIVLLFGTVKKTFTFWNYFIDMRFNFLERPNKSSPNCFWVKSKVFENKQQKGSWETTIEVFSKWINKSFLII